jgi:hypothetical protein
MRLRSLLSFALILFGLAVVGLALAYTDHAFGGPGRRPVRRDDIAAIAGAGMVVLGVVVALAGTIRRASGGANQGDVPSEADEPPTA